MKRAKEIFIIGTCLLMWAAMVCGWTDTLKTNTPAYDDDPREADDRMREIKGAFVERLDIDHYFKASATSTYDATDTGKHRYVTFREPNSIVSVNADEYILSTKDVNSIAELHGTDENEAEVQITSDGYLYGNSLKASSVLTAAIADANVTLAKMDVNSIDSNQYVDGSIDTVHIADANITTAKIADANVPSSKLITYDSGWFEAATSTTYTEPHSFGAIPFMVQVWFSTADDDTGDVVLVGNGDYAASNSTWMCDVDATNIIVRTGGTAIAQYVDSGGTERVRTSGYLKIKALK